MRKYKIIGIVGGQGPASTIDFYNRIITYFQDHLGATYISDYPPMIMYSIPTPTLVKRIENDAKTYSLILDAVKKLERDGADFIMITCVSLQYFIDRLEKHVTIPIVPMSPVLARHIHEKRYRKVGLLATHATIKKKIFDKDLQERGIQHLVPRGRDQDIVEEIILRIIAGRTSPQDKKDLYHIVRNLQKRNVDAILLACTEFPLILKQKDYDIPIIDCNDLYTKAIVQYAIRKT